MFGMHQSPAAIYAKTSLESDIGTADPHRLIVMLFEGAQTAIVMARTHMEQKNVAEKGAAISKAIDIITNGLKASLDMASGGELADRLAALYDYMTQRLLWANLKNEPAALDEVLGLLNELRGAWEKIAPGQQEAA